MGDEVSVAVDINYNKSVAPQIEPGLIKVINRSQEPILRLMETFKITEHSRYCFLVINILDICKCYTERLTHWYCQLTKDHTLIF